MRSEQHCQSATTGNEVGEVAEMIWQQKLDEWMRTSQTILMIKGRIESLDSERGHTAEQLLQQDGILGFPPVE